MHHCEVASIDRKRDLPPPPPPCKWIGPAEIPERTQVCTRCQPGETQGKTILLWPQTPSRLFLLSKRREVVFIRGGYYGRWNGGGWFVIVYLWNFPSKNKKGSECRVSGRVNSVLGCTGSCGNMSRKQIFKKNGYNDVAILNSSCHLHQPTFILLWEKCPFLMMMLS